MICLRSVKRYPSDVKCFGGVQMGNEKKVSDAVIRRLPLYYRYLSTLSQMGISRVSSKDLGGKMGITPSQVRQDFFNFGEFGLQGYGYEVDLLRARIADILGLNSRHDMVIVGAGNLGQALAKHLTFEKIGYRVRGIFDVNPHIIGGTIRDMEIMHFGELAGFVKQTPIDIAVITVPSNIAREVADEVIELGIKGIWNFASVKLTVPDDVSLENIHLIDSLMVLGYNMKEKT